MKELIDQYGRKINYLRISVTDRCNLRCIYCMPESGIIPMNSEDILTYEEIMKIAQVAVSLGINKIRLTGGEPLLRKNVIYLISALSKLKGIDDLSLTTNGLLLSEYVEDLKKVGLKRINISLDTLDREKYKFITGSDSLNKVWEGISKALKIGLNPVKINVVVMKDINDDEIIEFAKLTREEPLHIRFIELMPVGNSNWWTENKFVSNNEVIKRCENIGELEEEKICSNDNISLSFRLKNAKGTISFISPMSTPFCSKCSRLRLTSDGKLKLCLGSPAEINLMPIIRSSKFSFNTLKQVFYFAANSKPKGHCFNSVPYVLSSQGTMCQIGG